MLAQVTVDIPVGGNGTTDGGGDQAPGLIGAASGQDAEGDAPRDQFFQPLSAGDDLASGGQNAGNMDQVSLFNSCIAQSQLEGTEFVFMSTNSFGEEKFSRD